jgi:hypothetical protein
MYPLLFFFFYPKRYQKVTIKMTFAAPNGQNPNLEDLNEFLGALSAIHEAVILNSQEEYKENKKNLFNNVQILDHHKLSVIHICRKNPFDLELTFYILKEGLLTYWPLIKALFSFCRKYGRNHNQLEQNALLLNTFIDDLSNRLRKLLNLPENENFESLSNIYNKLMKDKNFKRLYDMFCSTALTITSLISKAEDLNDLVVNLLPENE